MKMRTKKVFKPNTYKSIFYKEKLTKINSNNSSILIRSILDYQNLT